MVKLYSESQYLGDESVTILSNKETKAHLLADKCDVGITNNIKYADDLQHFRIKSDDNYTLPIYICYDGDT